MNMASLRITLKVQIQAARLGLQTDTHLSWTGLALEPAWLQPCSKNRSGT